MITWERLVELEPQLGELYKEAKAETSKGNKHYCANAVWFRKFKPRLSGLVGYFVNNPSVGKKELYTDVAYDLAYHKIINALPDCRDCRCL